MKQVGLVLGVVVAVACGGAAESKQANGAALCSPTLMAPGDYTFEVEHGGMTRVYDVHLPPAYDGVRRLPVVFYFHPLLMDREYMQSVGTLEKADAEGFIAVYADGINNSWSAGSCCGPSNGAGNQPLMDDVGFVRRMVAAVDRDSCVDRERIYATGFSNGGFLSHRLACDASDLFAAVAPVSSVNGMPDTACNPLHPVPVMAINGTDDKLVPYAGGLPDESDPILAGIVGNIVQGSFASVDQSFGEWAVRDGCTDAPQMTFQNGSTVCMTHSQCDLGAEVTQCTVSGGGHCWFGEPNCVLGVNSWDLVATDATWNFLRRFSHPTGAAIPAGALGGTRVFDDAGSGAAPPGTPGDATQQPVQSGQPGPALGMGEAPVSDNPPTAGIDLTGTWALKQFATQNVMAPLVGAQVSEVTTLAIVEMVHSGNTVTSNQTICDMTFSEVAGTTTMWPAAAIAALPPASSVQDVDTLEVGSVYRQSTVGPLGWETPDPANDPLPPDAMDTRVVDSDGDGNPGVTINLIGLIGGDVYVVARTATEIEASLVSPDRVEGSHRTVSEQKVIGASNPLLMSDVPSTADPDPTKNPITLVRLAGPTTCADLVASAPGLF